MIYFEFAGTTPITLDKQRFVVQNWEEFRTICDLFSLRPEQVSDNQMYLYNKISSGRYLVKFHNVELLVNSTLAIAAKTWNDVNTSYMKEFPDGELPEHSTSEQEMDEAMYKGKLYGIELLTGNIGYDSSTLMKVVEGLQTK